MLVEYVFCWFCGDVTRWLNILEYAKYLHKMASSCLIRNWCQIPRLAIDCCRWSTYQIQIGRGLMKYFMLTEVQDTLITQQKAGWNSAVKEFFWNTRIQTPRWSTDWTIYMAWERSGLGERRILYQISGDANLSSSQIEKSPLACNSSDNAIIYSWLLELALRQVRLAIFT